MVKSARLQIDRIRSVWFDSQQPEQHRSCRGIVGAVMEPWHIAIVFHRLVPFDNLSQSVTIQGADRL